MSEATSKEEAETAWRFLKESGCIFYEGGSGTEAEAVEAVRELLDRHNQANEFKAAIRRAMGASEP